MGKDDRYIYVKNGVVITELEELGEAPETIPRGGPRIYAASFLRLVRGHRSRLYAQRHTAGYLRKGLAEAITFPYEATEGKKLHALRKLFTLPRLLFSLVSFRPRIVVSATNGPVFWTTYLAARLTGAKFIVSRHTALDTTHSMTLSKWARSVDKKILPKADAIICHGKMLTQELRELNIPEQRLIRYEIDYGQFREQARASIDRPTPYGKNFILYVGRLVKNKGPFDLLEAVRPLLATYPDLQLVFAGGGEDHAELVRRIEQEGLEQRIFAPGNIHHSELAALMSASLAVVAPTRKEVPEGRCKVTAEAFVLGVPAVVPAFGPFLAYCKHEDNALLYEPNSIPAMRQALQRLLDDPQLVARLRAGATAEGKRLVGPKNTYPVQMQYAFAKVGVELQY